MFNLDYVFSWPMIFAFFVILHLWIFLQIALEVNLLWVFLNPINFGLIFNILFGVTYQIKTKKRKK